MRRRKEIKGGFSWKKCVFDSCTITKCVFERWGKGERERGEKCGIVMFRQIMPLNVANDTLRGVGK
jgi:hypothetical protein